MRVLSLVFPPPKVEEVPLLPACLRLSCEAVVGGADPRGAVHVEVINFRRPNSEAAAARARRRAAARAAYTTADVVVPCCPGVFGRVARLPSVVPA